MTLGKLFNPSELSDLILLDIGHSTVKWKKDPPCRLVVLIEDNG